jgi:3'-phosphoadenosine 5'-phosphosulfate sulfotransferase (PAPS reductase)/FAD synthetase
MAQPDTQTTTPNYSEIPGLIERGALFVINHSGGKDSQAMYLYLVNELRIPSEQVLVIHADLPGVDWEGTEQHIRTTIASYHNLEVVRAGKTFMEMVENRQMWPSPKYRQCTSDLKRGPIEKAIRHHIKNNNLDGLVVNCMGLRAEESCMRAKATTFKFNKKNSKAGREWYDWLPIHHWDIDRVFQTIANWNQEPHWAYAKGMSRLSCRFCIMSSDKDLKTAAKLAPEAYQEICNMERKIDQTFMMPRNGVRKFLNEIVEGV